MSRARSAARRCGSLAGIGKGKTSFQAVSMLWLSEVEAAPPASGGDAVVTLSSANFLWGVESLNVRSSAKRASIALRLATRGMVGAERCCDSQRLTSRHHGAWQCAALLHNRLVENLKGHGPTPRPIPLGVVSHPLSTLSWVQPSRGTRLLSSRSGALCDAGHRVGQGALREACLTRRQVFCGLAFDRFRRGRDYFKDELCVDVSTRRPCLRDKLSDIDRHVRGERWRQRAVSQTLA
jgi:hypothetical protein